MNTPTFPPSSPEFTCAQFTDTSSPSHSLIARLDDSQLVADLPPWYFEPSDCFNEQLNEADIQRMLNESNLFVELDHSIKLEPFTPIINERVPIIPPPIDRRLVRDVVRPFICHCADCTTAWEEEHRETWDEENKENWPVHPLAKHPLANPPALIQPSRTYREPALDIIEFPLADLDDEADETILWEERVFSTSLPDESTLKKMRY
jgi:hypothetical protein